MNGMAKFWAQEAKEPAHRNIKKTLLRKAGGKIKSKKTMKTKTKKVVKTKKSDKVSKVMREFSKKELRSGSKKGPIVTNPKQAIAISLSEARKKGARIPKKKK